MSGVCQSESAEMSETSETTSATTDAQPANRLALSIQKGGTGKTTTTVNLAGALNDLGDDVLVVDMDPQGFLTESLGFDELYYDADPSLHELLLDPSRRSEVRDLIVSHDEMDLLPSSIQHFLSVKELYQQDVPAEMLGIEWRLDALLDEVETDYDWILVDSPPSLDVLNDNALLATESVLVPAQARTTSIRAINILLEQIESLEADRDVTISIPAIVASEVTVDGEADEMVDWFEGRVGDNAVFEIRKRVALQRAYNNEVSIIQHDEECDMESIYRNLGRHLSEVMGDD